ncbi:hypothetical protein BDN72DRAFT_959912 [Pluteus cervinus]|uniref:Uncharacterized protein n=1 Tax=Pluteus cervinus TaxID=181527 RepID=A0ACD3ATT3_9AGAR|nr:hypothetical protein BDN72DRAFT_959912 [Pluteus cervinus]
MEPIPVEKRAKIIDEARKGSLHELSILAKAWYSLPNAMDDGIPSIFFHHLSSSLAEVPTEPNSDIIDIEATEVGSEEDPVLISTKRAFWSLWGITYFAALFSSFDQDPYGPEFVQAWPGIFKWSAFLYTSQVQISSTDHGSNSTPTDRAAVRGATRDVIAGSWSALASSEAARKRMLETHGVLDIATRLWIFEDNEDVARSTPFAEGFTFGSVLIELLMHDGDAEKLEYIISAAGGDLDRIAQTLLRRLKKDFNSSKFASLPHNSTMLFLLVRQFCDIQKPEPFLKNGAISICVKLLLRTAFVLNQPDADISSNMKGHYVRLMLLASGFLHNFLDHGNGVPWVLQAINAGLLTAFIECSPMYENLENEDYITVSFAITKILPRYLAYICVVRVMNTAFERLGKTEQFLLLPETKAWEGINALALLTGRRMCVVGRVEDISKESTKCSNPQCEKVGIRGDFKRCAKCEVALYCSKACQTVHWKLKASASGHKHVCNDPRDVHSAEGENMCLLDYEYLRYLSVSESSYSLACLRQLKATRYPSARLRNLVVIINYDIIPITYQLCPRSEWAKIYLYGQTLDPPKNSKTDVQTIIVAVIPAGRVPAWKIVRISGEFLNLDPDLDQNSGEADSESSVDSTGNGTVHWLDRDAEIRRKYYCGV